MTRHRVTAAVIGEGITEKYYIQSLREAVRIKPSPVKPKKSTLKELELAIKACIRKGYDRIYCMIDMDNKVHDGNPDHERNAGEYARLKRQYNGKLHNCPDGSRALVKMVESFPATEIFFLYYFGYTGALYSNHQLKSLLNKRFGYLTEEKYLIKHSLHDLLTDAGGSLQTALSASMQSKPAAALNPPEQSYSEIGDMIQELIPVDF